MAYKNKIGEVLAAIDKKNIAFFESMDADQMKEISPYLLLQWLSGTSDRRQIILLNHIANQQIFSKTRSKLELIQLLMLCTSGNQKRYVFKRIKLSTKTKYPISTGVICQELDCSRLSAHTHMKLLTRKDIKDTAMNNGMQKDEMKKLTSELLKASKKGDVLQ